MTHDEELNVGKSSQTNHNGFLQVHLIFSKMTLGKYPRRPTSGKFGRVPKSVMNMFPETFWTTTTTIMETMLTTAPVTKDTPSARPRS